MKNNLTTITRFLAIYMICSICISCNLFSPSTDKNSDLYGGAIPIIFDTDIQGDWDDAGAMGMLHALADYGEIEILATVASNLSPLVVPCIDVINTYFGRPDIPIGAPKTPGVIQDSRELRWPDYLVENYPHTYDSTDEAPDAIKIYREILANHPDTSVVIVTVGFLTNMRNLLLSQADAISPLNGKELVAQKVKRWVAMAGGFPEYKETNVRRDSLASQYAIDNWPTPIIFSGFEIGNEVLTGLRLIEEGPEDSPVRIAYAMSIPFRPMARNGHKSWDQTALLVAARGIEPYYSYNRGVFITHPDGSNGWIDDPNGPHKHLVKKMDPDSVARIIEDMMMHSPQ